MVAWLPSDRRSHDARSDSPHKARGLRRSRSLRVRSPLRLSWFGTSRSRSMASTGWCAPSTASPSAWLGAKSSAKGPPATGPFSCSRPPGSTPDRRRRNGTRRHGPGVDRQSSCLPARRIRADLCVHRPCSQRGAPDFDADGGDVSRQHRRNRAGRPRGCRSTPSLCGGAALRSGDSRSRPPRGPAAHRAAGRSAKPAQSSGLPSSPGQGIGSDSIAASAAPITRTSFAGRLAANGRHDWP